MRKSIVLLLAAVLFGLILYPVQAGKDQVWVESQSIGAYICSCKPNANNPERNFYQGNWNGCSERFLLRFDLSSLPKGIQITEAKLSLFCMESESDDDDNRVPVYERIVEPWDENKVTFATQPKTTPVDKIVTEWPIGKKWHQVIVTQMVREWIDGSAPNFGILGYSVSEKGTCSAAFTDSNFSVTQLRPKLTINYKL